MFERNITLPRAGTETFFLWGPRQTGKTTLLKKNYPNALWIDFLKADEYRRYLQEPEMLRTELSAIEKPPFVVIDEVQKIPAILDEIHWLHEHMGVRFALCGSSARKVKREHGNLLGGRALRYELHGLSASEMGSAFNIDLVVNNGYLPRIMASQKSRALLNSYVADYLKEEIAAEGIARNLPAFSAFLNLAAFSDAEQVNFTNIGRECGVSGPTVKGYFDVLCDTLIGRWLPAYRKRAKRRPSLAPKFYFFDVGVVNLLAKRGHIERGTDVYGHAFENFCFHELCAYISYREKLSDLSYWRLPSGIEVDFIVGEMDIAIEAKAASKISSQHLKGLRSIVEDHSRLKARYVVSLVPKSLKTNDGIFVLSVKDFIDRLWGGKIF